MSGAQGPRVAHTVRVKLLLGADLVRSLDAHLLLLDVTVRGLLA